MATATTSSIRQYLEAQAQAIASQDFDTLGWLDKVFFTDRKAMDFGKLAPVLGRAHATGDLLILNPWPGLPDIIATETDLCGKCSAKCEECAGTGRRLCTLCGGTSKQTSVKVPCTAKNCATEAGRANPNCRECRGIGEVPSPSKCANCDEEGRQKCYPCNGSGKRPTGRNPKTNAVCSACAGSGRVRKTTPQPIEPFIHGHVEGLLASWPITGLLWHHNGNGNGKPGFTQCTINQDRNGNLMVLMLDDTKPGARAYLVGGSPSFTQGA